MRRILFLTTFIICAAVYRAPAQGPSAMFVTGYYPSWAISTVPPSDVDYSALTHIIYFSANPSKNPPYFDSSDAAHPWIPDLVRTARQHGVAILLCVGGVWGQGAKDMEFVAGDSTRVQMFVDHALSYAQRMGFRGIDIDWEPPSNAGDFNRMLRLFRKGLDSWQPRGILAAAVGVEPVRKLFDVRTMNTCLDQINIMDYDLGQGQNSGFNAALHPPFGGYTSWTIEDHGPAQWIAAGADRNKLALGIPFYGRRDTKVDGPEQKKSVYWSPFVTYQYCLGLKNASTYHWDEKAKVPWLGGTDSTGAKFFVSYEEPWSVQEKVYYASSLKLGGLMIYELSQDFVNDKKADSKAPLLRAVKETMQKLNISKKQ